jgi:hypothetical protein
MEAAFFLSVVILAITQLIKMALPEQVHGWITIIIAFVVGILVALFAPAIGVAETTIAEGIVGALGAIGISSAFGKAGGGTAGDGTRVN